MNKCGECTACCTLFPIEPINKPINTACQYSTGKGCSIYNDKPQMCTDFICAYLQSDNTSKSIRPDKCGIIFIKKTDRIFSGALIQGAQVTDMAKKQIQAFNDQGYSVILLSVEEKKPYIKLANNHDAANIFNEYKEAISGNL